MKKLLPFGIVAFALIVGSAGVMASSPGRAGHVPSVVTATKHAATAAPNHGQKTNQSGDEGQVGESGDVNETGDHGQKGESDNVNQTGDQGQKGESDNVNQTGDQGQKGPSGGVNQTGDQGQQG
jgi:hypothetical protein